MLEAVTTSGWLFRRCLSCTGGNCISSFCKGGRWNINMFPNICMLKNQGFPLYMLKCILFHVPGRVCDIWLYSAIIFVNLKIVVKATPLLVHKRQQPEFCLLFIFYNLLIFNPNCTRRGQSWPRQLWLQIAENCSCTGLKKYLFLQKHHANLFFNLIQDVKNRCFLTYILTIYIFKKSATVPPPVGFPEV